MGCVNKKEATQKPVETENITDKKQERFQIIKNPILVRRANQ